MMQSCVRLPNTPGPPLGIPFCTADETADPLTWYAEPGRGYRAYLDDLQAVFRQGGARWP